MSETIFSKIISKEIPSYTLYEDEYVFSFLDINPLSLGHTLVIPKEAVPTLDLLSDASAAAVGRVLPRICRAVIEASGCKNYNILQNNGTAAHQAVHHVHFHIIPKPDQVQGLGIGWPAKSLEPGDAKMLQERIRNILSEA